MLRRQRSLMVLAAACAGVVAFVPVSARAATAVFDNGGGDGGLWSNNANWDIDGLDGPVDGTDTKFDAAGSVGSAGTVTNIVDADRSILTLHYRQFSTAAPGLFHTTQINDGVTLTLNGSSGLAGSVLYAGAGANGGGTDHSHTLIQDAPGAVTGGTLSIQSPTADLVVRQNSTSTSVHMATLNMSGLSNFNADLRDVLVGAGDATYQRAMGTLYLAKNNTINADNVIVGSNTSGTTRDPSAVLYLGQNNTINTNSFTIGGRQTPNSLGGFNPAFSNSSLVLRGPGGIGRADLSVGAQPEGVTVATSMTNSVLDLAGVSGFGSGTVDARVGTLVLGRAGFTTSTTATARHAEGTFSYSAGVVDANVVIIGDDNDTANTASGTGVLNVSGTGQLVVNNSLTLGRKVNAGASVATGTLNLNGGKARVSGPVIDGGGSSTIIVSGGGSLQAQSLGSSASRIDTLNIDNGTVVVDVSAGLPSGAWGYVSSLNPNASSIGLNFAPGTLSAGQTIQAIDYSALGGGGFGAFSMAKLPARVNAHLVNGASSVDIVIDSADSPKWDGTAGNNTWDIGASDNWKLITAGTSTTYQEDLVTYSTTDSVLFNDDAAETNVNVSTTVAPNALVVNNPTKNYTFSGAGKITGLTGITKTGAGSLTIANTGGNDFTGGMDIQGGTVSTAASDVLPNVGNIVVSGTGALALGDFNETIGALTVSGGNASINNGALTAGTVSVGGGALSITGSGSVTANTMNYSGGAVSGGTGTITAGTLNLSNGVTLDPNAVSAGTVNVDDATISAGNLAADAIVATAGTINASIGGAATVTKNGLGQLLTLAGDNSYTGVTTYNDGILRISHSNALGSPTAETIVNNGGGTDGAGYLELVGGINVPEPLTVFGRRGFTPNNSPPYNTNPIIVNGGGNNTLSGDITLSTGGTNHTFSSEAGKLTIAGNVINAIDVSPALTRFLHLRGAAEGEISGDILITGSEQQDIIKMDAGTWTLSGDNNAKIQKTTVENGTLAFAGPVYNTGTLDVQGTALAKVNASGGTRVLRADTLTIATGAKLDLTDNKLITNNALGSASGGVYNGLQGEVQRAHNAGAWDGNGLTTSMPDAAGGLTTIGTATGEQIRGLGPTDTDLFMGQTITGASTIAMYTYAGDANLDGAITGDDYSVIDFNIAVPGADGYYNGDFNYDGIISGDDYSVIDFNIFAQGAPFPTSGSAGMSGVTAVPEPASACGLAIVTASLLARRRRRRDVTC